MRTLLSVTLLMLTPFAEAAQTARAPYVTQEQFDPRGDKHELARTWSICAALYNTLSSLNRAWEKPAQAEHFNNLGNGAEVAVAMTFVVDAFGTSAENISQSRFNATWEYAKVAMKEMPSVQQTEINANLEMGMKGTTELADEIQAIVNGATVCIKNAKLQQTYIDMWRELAMSGLLALPEDKQR